MLTGGDNWRITEAACLVEAGFGTSPEDRAILSRWDAPLQYALGVCRGIYRYCGWALPAEWSGESEPVPVPPVTPEVPIEPESGWAKEVYDAVAWAKIRGVSDGTRLTEPATRAEVLVMLRRLEGGDGA